MKENTLPESKLEQWLHREEQLYDAAERDRRKTRLAVYRRFTIGILVSIVLFAFWYVL
jgi:hypothetical protein